MFKILSKISIWYFIIGISISIWYYYYNFIYSKENISTNTEKENIHTVSTWSIKESIESVWTAQLVDEQSLKFKLEWTIKNVFVKEWQSIKTWEIIASLDDKDAQNNLKLASINLENSKINLQELYKEIDQSKILQSKNNIEITKIILKLQKKI